jgi:hypothetical protein
VGRGIGRFQSFESSLFKDVDFIVLNGSNVETEPKLRKKSSNINFVQEYYIQFSLHGAHP